MRFSSLSSRGRPRGAFALVIVLIIMSVLALVAVGYLSSMSQERATAGAFGNKLRAEQSAQAGVDTAMGILRDYFKAFPDSATVWEAQSANADGTKNEGTSLYLRAVPDASGGLPNPAPNPTDTTANSTGGNGPNNVNTSGVDNRKTFVLPLLSGATPVLQSNRTLPASTTTGYTNLNSRRYLGDNQGWIGSPPNYSNPANTQLPKPFQVPWVEIRQQDGYTGDAGTAPLVGRYAFWVEDESFRTNISYAGQGQTPGNIRRDNTTNCTLNPTDVDLVGTLNVIGDSDPATVAQNLLNVRSYYPGGLFPELRAFAHTAGLSTATANGLRFLTTSQSAALNLSRHGTQRLNLNAVVPDTTALGDAQKQLGEIVKAIAFHAPNFGQRFYRTSFTSTSTSPPSPSNLNLVGSPSGPTAAHATIYLNKIAANIRDYIDPDCIPTVVYPSTNSDIIGQVRPDGRPTVSLYLASGPSSIWAFGKDAAPFIQEAGVHIVDGRQPGDPATKYTVNIDYYVEVWNMNSRTVTGADLGPNAFVRIINPPAWLGDLKSNPTLNPQSLADGSGHSLSDTRTYGVAAGRDYDIDISGVTFPPGAVTVITTDPNFAALVPSISDTNAANQTEAAKHFVCCPILNPGKRVYTGTLPPGCDEVRLKHDYPTAYTSDYETEVIIGNDHGYIDSLAGAIPVGTNTISVPAGTTNHPIYGGYLRGNLATQTPSGGNEPSAVGDPRSNNEQLNVIEHIPSGSSLNTADQTGYKTFDLSTSDYQIPATFGLPNIYSIAPPKGTNLWPDYYWFPGNDTSHTISPALPGSSSAAVMSAQYAPGIIANAPLTSIGQLGDIYDPARLPATNTSDVTYSRGGGRSLRIGQHDDFCDGVQDSPSSGWASWRLVDFFSITDGIEQPGLININGLARDNGAALQAAFLGFHFQPTTADYSTASYDPMIHGDPTLAGTAYDTSYGLKNLIADMILHRLATTDITKIAPFFERGEISETPLLNPANSSDSGTAGGNPPPGVFTSGSSNVAMSTTLNRARQELVRRLIEMTTTRGSVFTVYAVGQAVNQTTANGVLTTHVQATHQLRVTFKLVPKTPAGDLFHPATDSNGNPFLFDPTSASDIAKRFAKPDHYDIQVLSITSGNT